MKGIIAYYSSTGNTRLACRYIAGKLTVPFDLVDVVQERQVDLEPYDVVGLATFTDFGGPPYLFQAFMEGLPQQQDKLAFVFNTYGAVSLKTLRILQWTAAAKGFTVIAGHSLKTPESHPPSIARGQAAEEMPDEERMRDFDAFISDLGQLLERAGDGQPVEGKRVRIGFVNSLAPSLPRTLARREMGEKHIDEALCTECGACQKGCPYGAIHLAPKPVFDMDRCYGCWRCYHRCPEHAIYTEKFRGGPFYSRPNDRLRKLLSV